MRDMKSRRSSEWSRTNPILRNGEPGFDRTSGRMKIGDGQTPWEDLPFVTGTVSEENLALAPVTTVYGGRTLSPPSRIISRFASGHGWTGGTDDTSVKLYGDRSYRGITNGTGTNLTLSSPVFSAQDWSSSYLRVALRISDPTKINNLQVFVDSGSVGNAYIATLATGNTAVNVLKVDEWTIFTIPRSAFSIPATPGWNNIVSVRIRVQDKSTGAVTLRAAAVELLSDRAAVYPNGVFVLEADDGFTAHKTILRPMLDALGVPCTLNPIVERITSGAAGLTVSDLQDMQERSGWQISAHAYTQSFHDNAAATSDQAETDYAAKKKWLHDNGFHAGADDYALCPGSGVLPVGAKRASLGKFWRSARMFSGPWETVIPSEYLSLRSLGFGGNTNATLQANIDQASGPGAVFCLSVHDVLSGSTNGTSGGLAAIAVNNLQTVISYALGKGMVPRTRSDWLALR